MPLDVISAALPLPSDFGLRLACGLAAMLLIAPWRVVPPAFFRTQSLVVLGALVGSALVEGTIVPRGVLVATIVSAVASYLASAFWGLGVARAGWPLTLGVALATAGLLVWTSFAAGERPLFDAASRIASAALLGSTLTAMLLGHHYLTAPAMSIDPLRRYVTAMAVFLAIRAALAAAALALWMASPGSTTPVSPMFLGMRWGMGVIGPGLATVLTWKTVQIRSTQSATGILYIAITLVLFGELAGLILARDGGMEF